MNNSLDTPVIFLIFNRPEPTKRVFEAIRAARPQQLYLVADGPRPDRPADQALCEETRAIVEQIDWDCDVRKDFSETNLGCAKRVSSGITSAFQEYDRAIILEDDCLPDASFFTFCSIMLERYQDDPRVMCVSGDNFQQGIIRGHSDCYFSKYTHIWGWATWKRAWDCYDFCVSSWPEWRESEAFQQLCPDPAERERWTHIFDLCHQQKISTWDFQWTYSCWSHGGATLLPNQNLVENIGFGEDGTHTQHPPNILPKRGQLTGFSCPDTVEIDREADHYTYQYLILGLQPPDNTPFLWRFPKRVYRAVRRRIPLIFAPFRQSRESC